MTSPTHGRTALEGAADVSGLLAGSAARYLVGYDAQGLALPPPRAIRQRMAARIPS